MHDEYIVLEDRGWGTYRGSLLICGRSRKRQTEVEEGIAGVWNTKVHKDGGKIKMGIN